MVSKFKNKKNIYNKVFILKGGLSVRDFSSADDVANIIIKLSKKNMFLDYLKSRKQVLIPMHMAKIKA